MSQHYKVHIDAAKTSAEFKAARKLISANTKRGLLEGLEKDVMPGVRAASPSVVSPYLVTKVRSFNGYVTTRGPRVYDRITGLLNFGGLVSTKVVPKRAKALHFRDSNVFVEQVGNGQHVRGRRYRGQHFIERGMRVGMPAFERHLTDTVMDSFGDLKA